MSNGAGSGNLVPANNEVLRLMGLVISNAQTYFPTHRVTTDGIDKCYEVITSIIDVCERIDFSIANGVLVIEGEPTRTTDPLINILGQRLADLEISGLTLTKGLTREEFGKLFEIIFTGVPGMDEAGEGMARALAEYGIEHVKSCKVTHRVITEQEEVVSKSEGTGSGRYGECAEADGHENDSVIEQITAFFKGDITGDAEQASKCLETMLLSDVERLAKFIIEASASKSKETSPAGEGGALADVVVAYLDRIRQSLLKDWPVTSEKRKSDLKKNLLLLQQKILSRMHGFDGLVDPVAETAISEALEKLVDGLEIQTISSRYVKKRIAFLRAEQEFVQRIKAMGAEIVDESGLGEELSGQGVSSSDWQMLLMKASAREAPSSSVSESVALLVKLNELITAGRTDQEAIAGVMAQANEQVGTLAAGTGQKIETLGTRIQQLVEAYNSVEGQERAKLKQFLKALLKILAEILQELCQPITVMSGAIEMTATGCLGPVNEQQKDMLELGVASGKRVKQLIERLIEIVGVPNGLAPDKALTG